MINVSRGLSNIAKEILEEAQKEAEALLLKAESDGKTLLDEAKAEAERRCKSIIDKAEKDVETKLKETSSLLDAEAKNELLRAHEELVEDVFNRTRERLKQYASSTDYSACLIRLISEASEQIGSDKLTLRLNKRDHRLMTKNQLQALSKKLGVELIKSDDFLNSVGGSIVSTLDGRIMVNNTFESRLEMLKPVLRARVARILFEEESKFPLKEP